MIKKVFKKILYKINLDIFNLEMLLNINIYKEYETQNNYSLHPRDKLLTLLKLREERIFIKNEILENKGKKIIISCG